MKKIIYNQIPENNGVKVEDKEHYTEEFYQGMSLESLESARVYLTHLWNFIEPNSVLDVGCGRGAWLKACHELGSNNLYGYDGNWNSQLQMIDESIEFTSIDLNEPFSLNKEVDLLITLEVAEHLAPSCSAQFVKSITSVSNSVLFSAAYTEQGGTNHINEQAHSYWASLFIENGYVPFDLFRPFFWGDKRVGFWYQQNTFLYLKKGSDVYNKIIDAGFSEIENINFMDCVHPTLYDLKCGNGIGVKALVKELIPSILRAIKRRIS